GRKPKLYEPTGSDIVVAIPRRRHEFLAGILTEAVLADTQGGSAAQTAIRTARERGEQVGASERARARPGRLGAERAITLAEQVLHDCGFEPARHAASCLRLRDCPFHPLASKAPELVCGINHAFLAGLLAGLRAGTVAAVLDPRAGECCVELRPIVRPQRSDQ
ncbi:MAG: transcriptional regulator, partial [Sciscionella sp.]